MATDPVLPDGPILKVNPSESLVQILGEGGEPLVTLRADGTVIFSEGYEPEEAARIFWQSLMVYFTEHYEAKR